MGQLDQFLDFLILHQQKKAVQACSFIRAGVRKEQEALKRIKEALDLDVSISALYRFALLQPPAQRPEGQNTLDTFPVSNACTS